jgi:hypothetical protein
VKKCHLNYVAPRLIPVDASEKFQVGSCARGSSMSMPLSGIVVLSGKLLLGIFIIVEDNTRKQLFKKKIVMLRKLKLRRSGELRDCGHRLAWGNNIKIR